MSVSWDPLLTRHLARELDALLRGARLTALRLDAASREVALLFEDRTLVWRLHPEHGHVLLADARAPAAGDLRVGARVLGVSAPPDERIVRLELAGGRARAPHALVVELLARRWNALVVESESGTIRHVLRTTGGKRPQQVGSRWEPPPPPGRLGVDGNVDLADWLRLLGPLDPEERPRALVHTFAWTSPLNARALLGGGGPGDDAGNDGAGGEGEDARPAGDGAEAGEAALALGWERWRRMAAAAAAEPVLLELAGGLQPYPFPLPGTPSRPAASLLDAFAASARAAPAAEAPLTAASVGPALLRRLEAAARRAERRARKLEDELGALEPPDALRRAGDLILARYAEIPQGAARARLEGFDGEPVEVELEPGAPPHESARRYYDRAAKAERARERLPALVEEARRAHASLATLLERAREGEAGEEEVAAALGPQVSRAPGRDLGPALPYRVWTSSGGLEIRVGRGARYNDDLTFRHSAPGDVWLHARHAAGAHVILRWPGPGRPPARDLAEAATLAALHSKARTSGKAPVDWTLRKYVRKPRGSPPGRVVAERVETLFVEPDPSLLERLAARPATGDGHARDDGDVGDMDDGNRNAREGEGDGPADADAEANDRD